MYQESKPNRKCNICTNAYYARPCHIAIGRGLYCSQKCYGISRKGKSSSQKGIPKPHIRGENHPNWVKKEVIVCVQCKEKFESGFWAKRKFCSKDCHNESRKKSMLGNKNPFWRGGKTPIQRAIRLSEKYNSWRQEILNRDDYTCQECGDRGGRLEVDHIISFSLILALNKITTTSQAFECDELWNIKNGRVLCKNCHIATPTYARNNLKQNYV